MATKSALVFFEKEKVKRKRPKTKRQLQLEEAKERAKTRKNIEGYEGKLIDISKDISNLSLDEAYKHLNAVAHESHTMRDLSNTHDLPISWAEYRRREEVLDEYRTKAQAQFQKRIDEREAKLKKEKSQTEKKKPKSLNIKSEKKKSKSSKKQRRLKESEKRILADIYSRTDMLKASLGYVESNLHYPKLNTKGKNLLDEFRKNYAIFVKSNEIIENTLVEIIKLNDFDMKCKHVLDAQKIFNDNINIFDKTYSKIHKWVQEVKELKNAYAKANQLNQNKRITNSPNSYPIVPLVWDHTMAIQAKKYKNYKGKINIEGWLMSEKLDGYRALWDGEHLWTNARTKNNKIIEAPEFFTRNLPPFAIDGELWIGVKTFSLMGVARMKKKVKGDKKYDQYINGWKKVRYMVFDSMANPRDPFDQRYTKVKQWFKAHPIKHVTVVDQVRIRSTEHMMTKFGSVLDKGGEGLMVRDPLAPYIPKRTKYILKVKPSFDEEAKIIGYLEGKGRLVGLVGAFDVVNEAGVRFSLGSGLNDKIRKNPPKIGTIVTYTYFDKYESGSPREPRFFRIRTDGYVWKGKDTISKPKIKPKTPKKTKTKVKQEGIGDLSQKIGKLSFDLEYEKGKKKPKLTQIQRMEKEKLSLLKKSKKIIDEGSLKQYSFCFTGVMNRMNRKEIQIFAKGQGQLVRSGVSSKLDYLVTNDPHSGTTKNRKAKELGVKVITEEEFFNLF